jgi:hypothetical protein
MENKTLDQPKSLQTTSTDSKTKMWLKRVGVGGFLFFLGKGLLWLFLGETALPALCN